MPRYLISYTERKKDGSLKKKQGVMVKKFRKLIKSQKIVAFEKMMTADNLGTLDEWWFKTDALKWAKEPKGFLSQIGDPNIMVEFTW